MNNLTRTQKEHIAIIRRMVGKGINIAPIDPFLIEKTAPPEIEFDGWSFRYMYAADTAPYQIFKFVRYRKVLETPYVAPPQERGISRYIQLFHQRTNWQTNYDELCRKALESFRSERLAWIQAWFLNYWTATKDGQYAP